MPIDGYDATTPNGEAKFKAFLNSLYALHRENEARVGHSLPYTPYLNMVQAVYDEDLANRSGIQSGKVKGGQSESQKHAKYVGEHGHQQLGPEAPAPKKEKKSKSKFSAPAANPYAVVPVGDRYERSGREFVHQPEGQSVKRIDELNQQLEGRLKYMRRVQEKAKSALSQKNYTLAEHLILDLRKSFQNYQSTMQEIEESGGSPLKTNANAAASIRDWALREERIIGERRQKQENSTQRTAQKESKQQAQKGYTAPEQRQNESEYGEPKEAEYYDVEPEYYDAGYGEPKEAEYYDVEPEYYDAGYGEPKEAEYFDVEPEEVEDAYTGQPTSHQERKAQRRAERGLSAGEYREQLLNQRLDAMNRQMRRKARGAAFRTTSNIVKTGAYLSKRQKRAQAMSRARPRPNYTPEPRETGKAVAVIGGVLLGVFLLSRKKS